MAKLKYLLSYLPIFSIFIFFLAYNFLNSSIEKIIFSLLCLFLFHLEIIFYPKKLYNKTYFLSYLFGLFSYFLFQSIYLFSYYFYNLDTNYIEVFSKIENILLFFLIISSIIYILLFFFIDLNSNILIHQNTLNKKKEKLIQNSIFNIFSFLILIFTINYITSVKNKTFDLSNNNYTISPYTKKILSSIEKKIYITAFYPHILENLKDENEIDIHKVKVDLEIFLNQFNLINPKIKVDWANAEIDREKTIPFGQVENGTIFLRSYQTNGTYKQEKIIVQTRKDFEDIEKKILSSILNISQKKKKLYFTDMHGERFSIIYQQMQNLQINEFRNLLYSSLYELHPLNHLSRIPKDADGLLIIGATNKFPLKFQNQIWKYIQNGGKLFLCIEPNGKENFSWLLKNWNIQFKNQLLIDDSFNKNYTLFTRNINRKFILNQFQGFIFPYSSYFEQLRKSDKSQIFIKSDLNTYLDYNHNQVFDKNDLKKDFFLSFLLNFSTNNRSKILIFSSTAWISDEFIHYYSNSELAIGSINLLMKDKNLYNIKPKKNETDYLNLNISQKKVIWILTMFIYPFFIFIICFFIKRKI